MKVTKKLLSLWLALVMVVSMLPTTVLAAELEAYDGIEAVEVLPDEAILTDAESAPESGAEEAAEPEEIAPIEEIAISQEMPALNAAADGTTVVIAGSDFQDPGGDAAGADNVKAILTAMQKDHPTANGLIFCGDYDKALPDRNTQDSINALKNAVASVYRSRLDEFFVQGNHDQVAQGTNGLTGPGAHDTADYGVYLIDEDDYQWSSGVNEAKIKTTAANLKSYLDAKVAADYSKPIFVASHVPLHFTPRTQEGDGKYAKYIFDVLQSAGESGLHIIFLYGHDHSQGWDNYLGGAAVYLAVGDNINIAVSGSGTSYTENTLKFTYMNAGFTGYYADWEPEQDASKTNSGVDKIKTMTVFTITDEQVEIERYDASGVHVLKSEGKQNVKHTTRTNPPLNTTVYQSPQVITLSGGTTPTVPVTDLTDSGSGISVTAKGTGLTVTAASNTQQYDNIAKYAAYDIQVADFVSGSTATVSIPVPAGYNTARVKVYSRDSSGNLTDMHATVENNGKATFTTTQLGTFMVAEGIAERTYTRVTNVSQLASGQQYLLIYNSAANTDTSKGTDSFVSPTVVTKSNGSTNRTGFDLVSTAAAGPDTITGTDYIDYEWTLTGSDSGWKLSSADGEAKLTSTTSNGIDATLEPEGDTFTISGSADNFTFVSGSNALNYNSRGLINGYTKDTNPAKFYIYLLTDDGAAAPLTDDATGVSVTTTAGETMTVSEVTDVNADWLAACGIVRYRAYNITIPGFVNGTDEATVSLPVPNDYNPGRTCVFYVGETGLEFLPAEISGGKATFTANHFSVYGVGETETVEIDDDAWVEIEGDPSYIYTRDTDGVDSGAQYLIVAPSAAYALINNNGNAGRSPQVTINSNTITLDTDAYDWTITSETIYASKDVSAEFGWNSNSYTLPNPTNYYYLVNGEYKQVTSATCTRSGYLTRRYSWTINYDGGTANPNTEEITLYTRTEVTGYTIQKDGRYLRNATSIGTGTNPDMWTITGTSTYKLLNSSNYYLRYRNNAFSYNTSNDYNSMRLFKLTETHPSTTYVAMTGDISYTFGTDEFANRDALEAYLKKQIAVYKTDAIDSGNATPVNYTLTPSGGTVDPTKPGTVKYTVKYDGTAVGTLTVTFVTVTGIELVGTEGSVYRGKATNSTKTHSQIKVTYSDGSTANVDVTVGMLSGTFNRNVVGDYSGLTVTYGDKTASGYTLHVLPNPDENDDPDYPDGGSVRVGKTGSGIDFQSTGVAQVELTATGVPVKKGIDVIVMVDTSSSMKYGNSSSTNYASEGSQRINMLRNSLRTMLRDFQVPNEDGSPSDIRVAIADFNGYTASSTRNIIKDTSSNIPTNANNGRIFTNTDSTKAPAAITTYTGHLADAFVNVNTITVDARTESGTVPSSGFSDLVSKITAQSGTNYDYAFDAVYQLGEAIKAQNEADGDERDLYVIFMSDGTPFQYNYYMSQSSNDLWNGWLTGTWNDSSSIQVGRNGNNTNPEYYNGVGNSHRMADAIKGSPVEDFSVIKVDNDANRTTRMESVKGLGATMYSVGFCIYADTNISQETTQHVIENIASMKDGKRLYYDATDQDELDEAFTQISRSMKLAATNAYFTDTMGEAYDIQLKTVTNSVNGVPKTIAPKMEVKEYTVYKNSDVNGTTVTADMVGTRTGAAKVLETVTFNPAGTKAYSDKLSDNILSDGVICAKNFWYNTTADAVTIDVDGDGTAETSLPAETFYWKIGTIGETEVALSYYVYLTGSMEGEREAGSYPTNESAVLHYTNWLGHDWEKPTISPVLPWKEAHVSYAFYLVDENGDIIVNRSTGATGPFVNRIALTNPAVYKTVLLNSGEQIDALEASKVLPADYELYDPAAQYQVYITSDGSGSYWSITGGDSAEKATTYVTDYSGGKFTNQNSEDILDSNSFDYTGTTVWFAVKMSRKCVPDTVVIDYGIPVDIDVLANDLFGSNGTLAAIGRSRSGDFTPNLDESFHKDTLNLTYGAASIVGGKVRYSLNTMKMEDAEKFSYAVKYKANPLSDEPAPTDGYYYSDVTVIPATIIYYEDNESFVSFTGDWSATNEPGSGIQAQDRPGEFNYAFGSGYDVNNVYGYDQEYENCTTYSLGSAHKTTVAKGDTSWPTAQFTFTGTGFDIISLTSKATGAIKVKVYEGDSASGSAAKTWIVNTYYGYTCVKDPSNPYLEHVWEYGADKAWHLISKTPVATKTSSYATEMPASPKADDKFATFEDNYIWRVTDNNALYQIPVIKSSDALSYGTYTVVITPMYEALFDNADAEHYDFYLDAIRIYNPAQSKEIPEEAYLQDKEGFPEFIELRGNMLNVKDLDKQDESSTGIVFIDGVGQADISDYTNYGPNHEVYLAQNQSVSFVVNSGAAEKLASIQLGVKALNSTATVSIAAVGGASREIRTNSATDLYYDITNIAKDSKVIVITNTGSSLVSLTNIKVTHTAEPTAKSMLMMSAPAAKLAVSYVNSIYLAAAPVEQVPEKNAEEPATTGEVLIPEKSETTQNTDNVQAGDAAATAGKMPENVTDTSATGENAQPDKDKTTEQNNSAANDSETVDSAETVTEESHRTFGQVIMDILRSIIDWITGLFRR